MHYPPDPRTDPFEYNVYQLCNDSPTLDSSHKN